MEKFNVYRIYYPFASPFNFLYGAVSASRHAYHERGKQYEASEYARVMSKEGAKPMFRPWQISLLLDRAASRCILPQTVAQTRMPLCRNGIVF